MPITINGSGTVTGISAGGLPDGCITTPDLADGAATQAKRSEQLTLGTAQASTSGTSIDFTGIPSWVKRVTVTGINVSTNGTSFVCLKLGTSSGVVTSGYVGNYTNFNSAAFGNTGNMIGEFVLTANGAAADTRQFTATLVSHGGNGWLFSAMGAATNIVGNTNISAGAIILASTLDRIRITTINGTDTFDAGSINIMYE